MDPYVPKMFFLKVDEDFLLYWCLIQKYPRIMNKTKIRHAQHSGFWLLSGWGGGGGGEKGLSESVISADVKAKK